MDIKGLSAASGVFQGDKVASREDSFSENNFLNSFLDISKSYPTADISQVYAGVSKELDFWKKEEESLKKPNKDRSLDDVFADIERVIMQLKKEDQ